MIDALSINDIENEIKKAGKGDYIALLLLSRYRKDPQSTPCQIIINAMNFHYVSGPDVDIYVPGFSFYGRSMKEDMGIAICLENSEPLGYYYPAVSASAFDFLRRNMEGLGAGSNLSVVAIEVADNTPKWTDGIAIDLSHLSASAAENKIMNIIDACKESPGRIQQMNVKYFRNSNRLDQLTSYLTANGWNIISSFSGLGALLLSP